MLGTGSSDIFQYKATITIVHLSYTFASQKICKLFAFREHKLSRISQNRNFRVLNFRKWMEKFYFFVVLRKRLDPDRNKREKKTLLFQAFVVLGIVFVQQTFL